MKVRELQVLLSRFDPNADIETGSAHYTMLINKSTGKLMLVTDRKANDLLSLMPNEYKRPW